MRNDSFQRREQSERLRKARAAAGLASPAAAVARHGWKQSTYMAHENGQNGLSAASATDYGKAYDVEPGWLLTGVGRGPKYGSDTAPLPASQVPLSDKDAISPHIMPRDVPVRGMGACGPDGRFAFESGTIDYVRRPPRLAGNSTAYALYTSGSSMSPWREEMQLVYVLPSVPVQIGDHVVVQIRDAEEHATEAYIKKLVGRNSKEIRLLQYNPRKEIKIPLGTVVSVHKIVEWSELLGI